LWRNKNEMTTGSPHFARTARPTSQGGFTLIELLIVVAMIAVLATIAFPILLRARITSNEGVAVASLRTIHSAEAAFAATCGSGGYAQSLEDLALKPMGSTVGFITDPYNTNGVITNGYVANVMGANGATTIVPAANTCNGAAADAVTGFVAERHAVSVGETGVRSFAIDTQGTMYMRQDGLTIDDALSGTLVFQ
jgi:prepilin-type N-terminal cleavage/methylation domain-containing protein